MTKAKQVKITPAKGRPMLSWVGKRPLRAIPALPAQHVEAFDPSEDFLKDKDAEIWEQWPSEYPKGGLLFHGDNKEVLAHLLANGFRGKVNLIYIDPPFDSGADYVRKINLRGQGRIKLDGEGYTLGEQIQYTDIWANDNYLQFMYERLMMMKELLAEDGSFLIHCDDTKNYLIRCLLDEVFSQQFFVNEIIWKRSTSTGLSTKRCGTLHDTIYWYATDHNYKFNMVYHAHDEKYFKRARKDENGRLFIPIPTGNPGPRPNLYYEYKGYWPHPNGYKWTKDKMEQFDKEGRLLFPDNPDGRIQYKQYLDEMKGIKLQDLWTDIPAVNPVAQERIGYPTQKPVALIERIIQMTTNPGDIVFDCFVGSGTTAEAAQKLGRRWIGCDINKGAIQTTAKRLQTIISEQIKNGNKHKQNNLEGIEGGKEPEPDPSQLGFTVWRVNDYDLQIQHNEAVNLACEYIGVERKRGDAYFDGTLGKKLVKIVPFNHPLSPLDLDELKKELQSRPDEDRDIVLVSLGMEISAQSWVEDWNKHRGESVPNKVEIIELRTDPKYAGFIKHDPATAKVSVKRSGKKIKVEIKDFISPTIIKRLDMEQSLFKAKITDWRSQVDCVMIDTAYDGSVFNVALSDVPEKKDDLVEGKYELPAPDGDTKVAVKIIDMLGEEVLEVREI